MSRPHLLFLLLFAGLLAGCDNVGRAFDPDVNPNDPGAETGVSAIQIVRAGGVAREGRPQVRASYPEGAGWPRTVPIVVEFSESVNEQSLAPTTANGVDGRIGVRVRGTSDLLPAQYDFVANGRLLVIRPLGGLPVSATAFYEVVLFPEGRDIDGVRFQLSGDERVLSSFQVNQDEGITNGRIVAVFPRDNGNLERESSLFVAFDRAPNLASLQPANLFLAPDGGAAIDVEYEQALTPSAAGVPDLRVIELDPAAPLQASTRYEFTVTDGVTFGTNGRLDFSGRTPFTVFDSIGPAAPTLVELGNSAAGFENRISSATLEATSIAVTTPSDTRVGDRVRVRIYGGDPETEQTFDNTFLERIVEVPGTGEQVVTVDFSGLIGTSASPALDEGAVSFAAQMVRGSAQSGYVLQGENVEPLLDVTPPEFLQFVMPGDGLNTAVYLDTEHAALYGAASEQLSGVQVEANNLTHEMFGSSASGRFLVRPFVLNRPTGSVDFGMTLTDLSGNSSAPFMGRAIMRGIVTGSVAGAVTVEAYDESTLQPIPNAWVLVENGAPGSGVVVGAELTGVMGQTTISGVGATCSVTILADGYDIVTYGATSASAISMPLRRVNGGTAELTGSLAFTPTGNQTAIVGCSGFADRVLSVSSTTASPTSIPPTAVRANRPLLVSAFGGRFEPTGTPTFAWQGLQILGNTLLQPTAPVAPAAPGEQANATFALPPAPTPAIGLAGPHTEDFGLATDLDLTTLVGGAPRSRVTTSVQGFEGQVVSGIGAVSLAAGTSYSIEPTFAVPMMIAFDQFGGASWLVTEAEDADRRLSRARALVLADQGTPLGTILAGIGVSPIPTIVQVTTPGGLPQVEFNDTLSPTSLFGLAVAVAMYDVTATDTTGRRWRVMSPDRDAVGGQNTLNFPSLAGLPLPGLAAGDWTFVVEAQLSVTTSAATPDDLTLSERNRLEVNYARSAAVTIPVP